MLGNDTLITVFAKDYLELPLGNNIGNPSP